MTYAYQSDIFLENVKLNVRDLAAQTAFYADMIGMTVINQTETTAELGFDGQTAVLLLEKTDIDTPLTYGLYHTAFLVPDRQSLGLALRHLVVKGAELEGGADHGYSEAIYLHDLEGNSIEIYRDKPVSEWDIRDNGQIIGVTEELDAQSLVDNLVNIPETFKLPVQTRIGHVHLSVKDALKSSKLYQTVFGLGDKMAIPSASWIASGQYHHHLAFNQWAGSGLENRFEGAVGLAYLSMNYDNPLLFQASLKKTRLYGMTIISQSEKTYMVEDADGIRSKVSLVDPA